ncbi:MAG: Tyrosine-tRNA ligase [Parcubacteria group bacterium GW2011_GWB1_41_6]|nr:MAG: Tyrosine-tRNA ligase [Parcubacteria group bacterium GW2011_GWB1_41_6]
MGFFKEKINTGPEKIKEVLTKGVSEVAVRENLEKRLASGEKLRVKLGIDPTGPNIHIGRAVVLWKLKEFQDLGHQIIFIVGDYTAQIGDPSDKFAKRPFLSEEEVVKNMKTYKEQLSRILDVSKVEWRKNSQWLSKLKPIELDRLADLFTVNQMLARRNFKERWEKNQEISLREFHYPLYQGYDSVMVKADVEIGGFDQLFNLLAGRKIQEYFDQPAQDILTTKMLFGLDGRKMATTWGNVLNINEKPGEMFGKIMSIKDDLILDYFLLAAWLPEEEVFKKEERLKAGENPRDLKLELAWEITKKYWSREAADKARDNFIKTFQQKAEPEDIKEIKIEKGTELAAFLLAEGLVESKSDFRRLVKAGAIEMAGQIVKDFDFKISQPGLVKVGKRRFIRVIV